MIKNISILIISFFLLSCFISNSFAQDNNQQIIALLAYYQIKPLSVSEKKGLKLISNQVILNYKTYKSFYNYWKLSEFETAYLKEKSDYNYLIQLFDRYKDAKISLTWDEKKLPKDIATKFEELQSSGETSLINALEMGILLNEYLIYLIDQELIMSLKADMRIVYLNLQKSARNHLRLFYRKQKELGGKHTPQYIIQDRFFKIIFSEQENKLINDPGYRFYKAKGFKINN